MSDSARPLDASFIAWAKQWMKEMNDEAEEATRALGLSPEAKYDLLLTMHGKVPNPSVPITGTLPRLEDQNRTDEEAATTASAGVPWIGQRIARLMTEKRLDVAALAARAGVPANDLRQIVTEELLNPTFDFVMRIATGLGISLDELVRGGSQPSPAVSLAHAALSVRNVGSSAPSQDAADGASEAGRDIAEVLRQSGLSDDELRLLSEQLVSLTMELIALLKTARSLR